nr:moesin/ezrin/radixin homolog 1-like [Onthophagus taurus]
MDRELEFVTSLKTTGKSLFEMVSRNLGVHEIWFFGICYVDASGEEIWIDNSKKTLKDYRQYVQKLNYRVKYYPEDIEEELIEDNTIKYFFYQVRHAILNEKIYCPPDTSVLLASYACQARFGDYHNDVHNTDFLKKQRLLPNKVYNQHKMKPEEFHETILNMWLKHRGMMKQDAMTEYLKLTQNLEMYGVHYFEIHNKRGTKLLLGIHAIGLNIYKLSDKMNAIIMFPWSEIKNINFRDKKFTIKGSDKKSSDFIFFSKDGYLNKRILNLGVGNHYLYVRRRKPPTLEVIQMKEKAMEQKKTLHEQRTRLQSEISAREEAEKREKLYQNQLRSLREEVERSRNSLLEAQSTIQKLKDQLFELQRAKDELEKQQNELKYLMEKLEESKNMESVEKRKLEDEILAKQMEVAKIQEEVEAKNLETMRLQEEVEMAKRTEEELRMQQLKEIAEMTRREEEKELESLPENANDELPELVLVNEQLREQLKILQDKLEKSLDETKETELDKLHRDNLKEGRDKYKTLKEIRKGNTVRRVDLFENL